VLSIVHSEKITEFVIIVHYMFAVALHDVMEEVIVMLNLETNLKDLIAPTILPMDPNLNKVNVMDKDRVYFNPPRRII